MIMLNNVGKKIKAVASAIMWIGIILFTITAISAGIFVGHNENIWLGLLLGISILAVGILVCWLSALHTYGYGEIISKVSSIESKISSMENPKDND